LGTNDPETKVHIIDPNPASNRDEIIYSANGVIWDQPPQLKLGYRNYFPSIQAYRVNYGNDKLSLNPDGGNVGIGITDPGAALTIYKHELNGNPGVTNTLIAAGYNTYYLNGGRQFLVQQWLNAVDARTFIVGNGFVSGVEHPVANNPPLGKFQGLEFGSNFGFIWNNAGTITPALSVNPNNGKVGIGTDTPIEKLDVNGSIVVRNAVVNEEGKPAFLVSVDIDDCQGYWHPYLGCPEGYWPAGRWHTGPGICDYQLEGWGYENGQLDSGWMVLCVAQ
jgi:hypothetical protein